MTRSLATITGGNLIDEWARFLEIQAEICIKKDIALLSRLGLSLNHSILDFGCGVGAYTVQLRKHLPKSKIVATDINHVLLKKFMNKLENKPDPLIEVLHWDPTKGFVPPSVRKCKTCFIRLVLQHVQDPNSVLVSLKNALPKGANVVAIDEDDSYLQIVPEFPAFSILLETWKKYGKKYVNDRHMGPKLPQVLSEAGFKVKHLEMVGHTNLDWGIDKSIDFYVSSLHLIRASDPEIISSQKIEQVRKDFFDYKRRYKNDCFIVYPQVFVVAQT